MRQATHVLTLDTPGRGLVEFTRPLTRWIADQGLTVGLLTVFCRHTSASLLIQENADPDVVRDVLGKLAQLVPAGDENYRHAEGNSDAHIKASLIGASQTVLVHEGRLALGVWQAIYFAEFDGPRRRQMYVLCGEAGRRHGDE